MTRTTFHACERPGKAAGVFGEGTAAAKHAFERARAVSELLAVESEEQREARRRITDRTIRYFSKHVGRLNYAARLASWRPSVGDVRKVRRRRWAYT